MKVWMLVIVWMVFFLTGFRFIDPDFGWHYKMGELIAKEGIPKTDPFSYTMPSYPFVDYEWLTNVIWYLTYDYLGMVGWAVIYGAVAIVTMWIAVPKQYKKYAVVPMFLGWGTMLLRFGVRPQIINWFFWAVIVRAMWEEELWKKYRKFFPVLMLLWGNLHGSYPLGIVAIAVWLGLRTIQERKIVIKDFVAWGLGFLVTIFLNPYGWKNWAEVILVMRQGQLLREGVNEWAPFYMAVDFGMVMSIVLAVFALVLFGKIFKWWQFGIGIWMLYWGLTGLRYGPLLVIFATPIVARFWHELSVMVGGDKEKMHRFKLFFKIVVVVSAIVFGITASESIWRGVGFREERTYPVKAVEYLKQNGYEKNLFSDYGWGGYLIWKLPKDRYFIDGRMSCFWWEASDGESDHAFMDYRRLFKDQLFWEETVIKYNIKTVLWPATKYFGENTLYERLGIWLENRLGIKSKKERDEYKLFLERFDSGAWKKVYEDETAVILTKI